MRSNSPEERKRKRAKAEDGDRACCDAGAPALGLTATGRMRCLSLAHSALVHSGRQDESNEVAPARIWRRLVPIPRGGEYHRSYQEECYS